MKKKIFILFVLLVLIALVGLFFSTGGKRGDVFLQSYSISEDGKIAKLKVGVSSSAGYVRKMKVEEDGNNQYVTFYSTFGINQKLGAKEEFELALNPDCDKIYFDQGKDHVQLVLQKNAENEWVQDTNSAQSKDALHTENMKIALSLEDKIGDNTAWCGTFNLIWNDLKNDLAKQDIVFAPQPEVVENLNKGTFNTSQLAQESYYKVYGTPSLELKAEIEKAIQEKFNETSDILDDFDWNAHDPKDYFLYAMLKKEFEFPNVFTKLKNGQFGSCENVQYFGIDETTDEQVRNQVEVLYYQSKEDFAVKLLTQTNDEVIIARGNQKDTFGDIYQEILQKNENYDGIYDFCEGDILQVPNIKFDLKEEIKEVENQPFSFSNGDEYSIKQALQTIQFELNEKGGKIKSEAGMTARYSMAIIPEETREFIVDDTFTIFLKEQGKELPYFAAKIADITTVQKEAVKMANATSELNAKHEEKTYFYGKVVESDLNHILVEPREGEEIRNSADKISIGLGENNDATYEVGTNVKITYNGIIMETYPAQVKAIDIEGL